MSRRRYTTVVSTRQYLVGRKETRHARRRLAPDVDPPGGPPASDLIVLTSRRFAFPPLHTRLRMVARRCFVPVWDAFDSSWTRYGLHPRFSRLRDLR